MGILRILFTAFAILTATTLHEFVRAAVSNGLGDTLPKQNGRLTLNPFKHFEPIGFILMFATNGFGWGKPVDTSALYYKNRKQDTLLTAIMPSVANLILAFLFVILWQLSRTGTNMELTVFCSYVVLYNTALAVYNIVPISPMDGLKVLSVLMPANQYFKYLQYEKMAQMLFMLLLFFGLVTPVFSTIINLVIGLFQFIVGIVL